MAGHARRHVHGRAGEFVVSDAVLRYTWLSAVLTVGAAFMTYDAVEQAWRPLFMVDLPLTVALVLWIMLRDRRRPNNGQRMGR